jgi:hypothetical protein
LGFFGEFFEGFGFFGVGGEGGFGLGGFGVGEFDFGVGDVGGFVGFEGFGGDGVVEGGFEEAGVEFLGFVDGADEFGVLHGVVDGGVADVGFLAFVVGGFELVVVALDVDVEVAFDALVCEIIFIDT